MSTLQATNLKHGSSASNNLVLDANGNVTAAGTVAMATPFAMRNKIINGAMEIDQRNAGASVTPASGTTTYTVDRFGIYVSQASKLTAQQNAGTVTPPTGFKNYLGMTSSSAYSSLAADVFVLYQAIEGLNCIDLAFGTANAKTVTVSFWARSSITGTHSGSLVSDGNTRCYPFSFPISVANTWEYKTVTIPGDTTGTWLTTNGAGMALKFNLGSGSNTLATAGAWASGEKNGVTGSVSLVGTNGATLYITGVQLEVGTVATPFERRLFGTELQLAQRYYEVGSLKIYASGVGGVSAAVNFRVSKRAAPTLAFRTTSIARNVAPGSTEWAETESFGVTRAGNEIACVYTASAEL